MAAIVPQRRPPPPIEEPDRRPASASNPPPSRPTTPLIVQPRALSATENGRAATATAAEGGRAAAEPAEPNPAVESNETPNPEPVADPNVPLDSTDAQRPTTTLSRLATPVPAHRLNDSGTDDTAILVDGAKAEQPNDDFDVIFLEDVPADLECKVCGQVLRVPQKLPCGHRFCLQCVQDKTQCPTCGTAFDPTKLTLDREAQRRIQQLGVKCSFHDNGCPWTGVLKDLKAHAIGCEFADTICPRGCGEMYAKRDEQQHLAECTRRTVPCEFCGKEISAKGTKAHLKVCPKVIIDCPNRCGVTQRTRAEILEHIPSCPRRGESCPFADFGCSYTGGRQTIQQHIKEQLVEHLSFLCTGALELRELMNGAQLNTEKMSRNVDILQGRITSLEKLFGAQYIWRIDDYAKRFRDSQQDSTAFVVSPPFLTGRHGYKLIMSAVLFGDGEARGKYFSVYIRILRGDHDALLAWPFVHKVTLTLLDQNPEINERRHYTYAIKPQPTNENRPFLDRPTTERNAAFGAQKFVSLTDLVPYVREDVLFVKCNIDTEHMIVL